MSNQNNGIHSEVLPRTLGLNLETFTPQIDSNVTQNLVIQSTKAT